jgi:hypothetical protein
MSKNLLNTLLLVASFALYYVVINPLYTGAGSVWQPAQSIGALRASDDDYTETLRQAEELFKQAETLNKQYESVSSETKEKMKLMVPDTIDAVRMINEVNYIANQTGLTLGDLSYTQNTNATGPKATYSVSFSVKTTYTKFKELMANYETSLRLFQIQSVTFSVPEKQGELTNFQVKMETYHLK